MAFPNINKTKNNQQETNFVAAVDFGTSKICAIVGSPGNEEKSLNILGIGIAESAGLINGMVMNVNRTVTILKKVIEQAELQSGVEIKEVVVGIAGDHIHCIQTKGIIGIPNQNVEISHEDVQRVLEESRKIAIPSDRRILHVIPQDFVVDTISGIDDPVGMTGTRLEANVYIITALSTLIDNIYKCVERTGLIVKDIVLEPLASSIAVLDEDEKDIGVALIDIGGGSTDIAIFEHGVLRFTSIFGIAGKKVTDDIQKGLGIVVAQAEKAKKEFGHTYLPGIMRDESFMIPGIAGRRPIDLTKKLLCQIIQPRMEEIFEFANAEIVRSGYADMLGAGIVITGGCCLLRGSEDLAMEVFGMPVKLGVPTGISYSGLAPEVENPMYSTAVGLALHGLHSFDSFNEPEKGDYRQNGTDTPKKKFSFWNIVKTKFDSY